MEKSLQSCLELNFLFSDYELETGSVMFVFQLRVRNTKVKKQEINLRVTKSKFSLIFFEFELINRKWNFYKIFELIIRSVTSLCITPNLNSYITLYFLKLLLKGSSSLRTLEEENFYRCSTFLILFCTRSLPLKIRLVGFCISVKYLQTNKIH